MPVTREKRKGGRSRFVSDERDENDTEKDGDETISVSIDEFMGWAQNAISKGDTGAIARLRADLIEARRKKNHWKARYEELAEETPEGAIILTDDEAAAITKIRERKLELKKLPELIEKFENDNATLLAENVTFKNRALYSEFSKTSGYNSDAIEGVVSNERLHAEMGDVKVEKTDAAGKKTSESKKTLMVRKAADPKAPLVPFDEYVEKNAKWMWPSIRVTDKDSTNKNFSTSQFPEQTTSHDGNSGGMLGRFLERANAAANPRRTSPLDMGAQNTAPNQQNQRHGGQRT